MVKKKKEKKEKKNSARFFGGHLKFLRKYHPVIINSTQNIHQLVVLHIYVSQPFHYLSTLFPFFTEAKKPL